VPTDDPKDPAPRRRKRSADTDAPENDSGKTASGKAPPARKPAADAKTRPTRSRRARTAEADVDMDAAATDADVQMDAAATTQVAGSGSLPEDAGDRSAPVANGVAAPSAGGRGDAGTSGEGTPVPDADHGARRARVEETLTELLGRMEMPATLDVRDLADGTFSVAVRFAALPPGVQVGRRSPFMDSLQFLTNKLLHQPRTPGRRWVSLGAMEHPPERGAKPAKANGAAAPTEPAGERRKGREKVAGPKGEMAADTARVDERQLEVEPDPTLAEAALRLAERSAKYGRLYTVLGMGEVDRARVVQAAAPVEGLRVSCEGEGRHRRVIFRPKTLSPLPQRTIPDWDDEEDVD